MSSVFSRTTVFLQKLTEITFAEQNNDLITTKNDLITQSILKLICIDAM